MECKVYDPILQDNLVTDYKKNIVKMLKQFDEFLGDRKFFAGEKVIDMHFYSC